MKFTLSLHDYMEQYVINQEHDQTHCPVCYQQVMTWNIKSDTTHLMECYRDDVLYRVLFEYMQQHDTLPALDERFLDMIDARICDELNQYYSNIKSV